MNTRACNIVPRNETWVFCLALLFCQIGAAQTPTIVPIPSLGGSEYMPYWVNASGQVVGTSYTEWNMAEHAFMFSGGVLTDLNTLGGPSSYGSYINNKGQVVGYSYVTDNSGYHAFLYSGGVMQDLGTLGGNYSTAVAINDAGQIIGNSFLEDRFDWQPFLYSGGVMTRLATLGGPSAVAIAVNASGWVAGQSLLSNGERHACIWKNGTVVDLGGPMSIPSSINDAGQVTGHALDANGVGHAFLYNGTTMQDLGTLGGLQSSGLVINRAGQVAGNSWTSDGWDHGFIYTGDQMFDLGTLGLNNSWVNDMNNSGQIVGEAYDYSPGDGVAFLWENGQMIDLNTLLPPESEWYLQSAYNISDTGHIVGYGFYQWQFSWFLLSLNRPVSQNTPPVANAGLDQMVECTGAQTPVVLNGSGSQDADGDTLTYAWFYQNTQVSSEVAPTFSFALGTYSILLRVTDPSGASSDDLVTIQVVDTTPPVIQSITANPPVLGPPSRQMVPVTVTVLGTDNCDTAPTASIVGIQSSEPETSPGDNTSPDWEITGPLTANLRSEGANDKRGYTITVECQDSSGNSARGTVTVSPQNGKGGKGNTATAKAAKVK